MVVPVVRVKRGAGLDRFGDGGGDGGGHADAGGAAVGTVETTVGGVVSATDPVVKVTSTA